MQEADIASNAMWCGNISVDTIKDFFDNGENIFFIRMFKCCWDVQKLHNRITNSKISIPIQSLLKTSDIKLFESADSTYFGCSFDCSHLVSCPDPQALQWVPSLWSWLCLLSPPLGCPSLWPTCQPPSSAPSRPRLRPFMWCSRPRRSPWFVWSPLPPTLPMAMSWLAQPLQWLGKVLETSEVSAPGWTLLST